MGNLDCFAIAKTLWKRYLIDAHIFFILVITLFTQKKRCKKLIHLLWLRALVKSIFQRLQDFSLHYLVT